jgi:aspartyl-tRNA(Asn)/glutamyl-tRNA(Gln) amidotransferase subunit A
MLTGPLNLPSIQTLQLALREKKTTAVEQVNLAAGAAHKYADLNPLAFTDWPSALQEAHQADQLFAEETAPVDKPLLGIALTIKDLFSVQGMPMKAGTQAPLPPMAEKDATLVSRLRAAGAIIIGKTNMHELALGATGENLWTGDVKNPYDTSRQSGGSSSGSAVAVAVGIGAASVGSDTGGSVRVPAAFCGLVGFKPSFNAIPLTGALYLSPSFDHAGPLARTVSDARLLYGVMANRKPRVFDLQRPPRLAVPAGWIAQYAQAPVAAAFALQLERLRLAGAQIDDVELPLAQCWEFYTTIVRSEAALVHREALKTHVAGFSSLVLPALQAGQGISAVDYLAAQTARAQARVLMDQVLRNYDAVVMPTSAIVTPLRGQTDCVVSSGQTMSVREAVLGQTLPFSSLGLPALQLPMDRVQPSDGQVAMPIGLQIVGNAMRDDFVLSLGSWIESLNTAVLSGHDSLLGL